MKQLLLLSLSFLFSLNIFSQSEFTTYKNGLIYSETTMNKLEHIVDSLNLKYKTCDLGRKYVSVSQTVAHKVSLATLDIKQAKEDMDKGISFEDFLAKYPHAKAERNVLVIQYKYYNKHDKKEFAVFNEMDPGNDYGLDIRKENKKDLYRQPFKNTWMYEYTEKSEYSKESIDAFYFPEAFKTIPLPMKYCRQIGYADCLIDTTTAKFKDNAGYGSVGLPENWQSLSESRKKRLLEEMRNTKVMGMCSQDGRPRQHAINIALLSAETTNWEVFLKSHLDIMNDRFDRMSDGSYAWGERKTYIKELEQLNINVPDLMFGISLRVEEAADNHYYGSIGRLGRAIAESQDKEEFKKQMLLMIEDTNLDDYNRLLVYFLFLNYNHYIPDKKVQSDNEAMLKEAVAKLPGYLKNKIK